MENEFSYHEGMRQLQDLRDTRALADRMAKVIVHETLTPDDRAFIEKCAMCFVATADVAGHPDCSFKGGLPGFIQVLDERTLAIPDYDGNGMYRSWGNILVNPYIGVLFINFEKPDRIRLNGIASIDRDDPLLATIPGAVFIVRITVQQIFPNCSRNIHQMALEQYSTFSPGAGCSPPTPDWKSYPDFSDVLPDRDRKTEA